MEKHAEIVYLSTNYNYLSVRKLRNIRVSHSRIKHSVECQRIDIRCSKEINVFFSNCFISARDKIDH